MFKNKRMQLLKYLLALSVVILSCKERGAGDSEKVNVLTTDKNNDSLVKTNDSIYVESNDLIIFNASKKFVFKDLIVNASSLNTSIEVEDENSFYLISEYLASSTKMTQIYRILYENENLFLLWKEVLKLDKGNFGANKIIYDKLLIPKEGGFDYIESLGETIAFSYSSEKSNAFTTVFDESYKKIDSIVYDLTGMEMFMNPMEIKKALENPKKNN